MSSTPGDGSMPSSFDQNPEYNEKALQKVFRRLKEEPLIPIGCGLTVFAFVNAYRAMRRGDHHTTNRMFRARVMAQGFTILAVVAGGSYYGADRQKRRELEKVKAEKEAVERRQQWIHELEIRDEEDKALKERIAKRQEKREAKTAVLSKMGGDADASAEKKEGGGGGWLPGFLGGNGGSKSQSPAPEAPKLPEKEELRK